MIGYVLIVMKIFITLKLNKMKQEKYTLIYDESDIVENQIKYLLEENINNETEEEIRKRVYNDPDLMNFEWNDFKECLTEDLNEIDYNKFKVFKIKGKNMGWRNLDGFKILKANNSEELLKGILPDTSEFSLYILKTKTQIKIKCSHHDSPMGEYYFIKPLNKKEFKEYEKEEEY